MAKASSTIIAQAMAFSGQKISAISPQLADVQMSEKTPKKSTTLSVTFSNIFISLPGEWLRQPFGWQSAYLPLQ